MSDKIEEWKSLGFLGYPLYSVSSFGRVKRVGTSKILKQSKTRSDYLQVSLYNRDGVKHCRVNRLVALAFLLELRENCNDEVHHINENKADNSVGNLMWLSHAKNCRASITGRAILQCSLNNEIIQTYEYRVDAATAIGCSPSTMLHHCENGKPFKGYIWKYNNNSSLKFDIKAKQFYAASQRVL